MLVKVEPEPSEEEREAIVAALSSSTGASESGWAAAALLEGVQEDELDEP